MTIVTLDIHCAFCGGAVTLQMSDWPPMVNHDGTPVDPKTLANHPGAWFCPYCKKENSGGFPGKIAWVTRGREQTREPT